MSLRSINERDEKDERVLTSATLLRSKTAANRRPTFERSQFFKASFGTVKDLVKDVRLCFLISVEHQKVGNQNCVVTRHSHDLRVLFRCYSNLNDL